MRIYPKLTLLSLSLALIPLALVAVIVYFSTQKDLKLEISERLRAVSTLKKERLETYFDSRKEDLRAVQGFVDIKIHLPTLQEFDHDRFNNAYLKASMQLSDQLRTFMNSYGYADIMLLDTNGKVVFNARPAHQTLFKDKTLFNSSELEQARSGIYMSGLVQIEDKKTPNIVYMVSAARNMQKKFSGYIVLAIDMKTINGLISNTTGIGMTGESFLVQKTPEQKFLIISPLSHDPDAMLSKTMNSPGKSQFSETIDYRGKKVLASWQEIPFLGWWLVTKIDADEFYAPIIDLRNLIITISILLLLIVVISSFVFAKSISRPIYQLQEGARQIGEGNLDHMIGIYSDDEIGQLSQTFDDMALNLKRTMASRDELEEEIVMREKAESEAKQLAADLHAMSIHDPLTNVLNRRGLQDVLTQTVGLSQRMGVNAQVLLMDLDNFKKINDSHGHAVGDAVLVSVTQQIQQNIRQTDHVARVGGDEFMVLLLDLREAEAVMVADKIRMAVAQAPVYLSTGEEVHVTCSMGIVPLGDHPVTIDGLLQKLRLSLHLSKAQGKNRIAISSAEGQAHLRNTDPSLAVKQVLVEGNKFFTASQPIYHLRDMKRTGYELLTRLNYEGYSSPDAFLMFARSADILGMVDYACLKQCLASIKDVSTSRRMHINIFPSTLAEMPVERLVQDLINAGQNINFCLEINEQQILGDPTYLIPAVSRLKKAGVMIALDDYGFGRSSVETLILLEPDMVKIDKKIIKDISTDGRKLSTLKRLLRVIDSCNAIVVAEGIETKEDLDMLLSLGVTSGQGYLLGMPQSPPDFT